VRLNVTAEEKVKWYVEKHTGRKFSRKRWKELEADLADGKLTKIVVWKLDRLGRKLGKMVNLFEELFALGVPLVSLTEGVDLSTPSGRCMANLLATVASYEHEICSERIKLGQAAAKAEGRSIGGGKLGRRIPMYKIDAVFDLANAQFKKYERLYIARIARTLEISPESVYSIMNVEGRERGWEPPNGKWVACRYERSTDRKYSRSRKYTQPRREPDPQVLCERAFAGAQTGQELGNTAV
jgi:DNA invertase Pin-like site-specific DNA recombinase